MSCARFDLYTVVYNLLILSSFNRPRESRKKDAPGSLVWKTEVQGTEEIKSIAKLPLK